MNCLFSFKQVDIIVYPYYKYVEVALRAGGEEVYGGWRGDGWSPWQPLVFVPIVCGMLQGCWAGRGGAGSGRWSRGRRGGSQWTLAQVPGEPGGEEGVRSNGNWRL